MNRSCELPSSGSWEVGKRFVTMTTGPTLAIKNFSEKVAGSQRRPLLALKIWRQHSTAATNLLILQLQNKL